MIANRPLKEKKMVKQTNKLSEQAQVRHSKVKQRNTSTFLTGRGGGGGVGCGGERVNGGGNGVDGVQSRRPRGIRHRRSGANLVHSVEET